MDIAEKAAKWEELLPKLEILRQYLFRVDHKLASLGEVIEEPAEIVDHVSAFLSVLEFYFPSTEEEALAAKELTRLEALGQELTRTGNELKEEVKREFASLKAQVETEIGRLEAENDRLRQQLQLDPLRLAEARQAATEAEAKLEIQAAELARLRPYTEPKLFAAACEVLDAFNDAEEVDDLGGTMERLTYAVEWWDSLPFDPAKDAEKLPKYEEVSG